MPNDDASNVNNNADEDDDRRRRAAASTRPDTHDHTLDRTPRHSLDDVTDDHNGRPGRRRTARLPAVSNHRRLLLSPLWLLIALATMLGLNASSAAAGGGLETRVRAFDHVTVDAVGQPSSERPASVGCLRPSQPGFASGSCVATEAAPPRFVAASDGIIDTEAPALQQQIGDVADSIQTTGSSPPGVRQGGLPGKPGVYGNKSGALPTQPEGYYTESDVWPGPGSRGTERIVVGANGEVWYSPDHYGNFRVVAT